MKVKVKPQKKYRITIEMRFDDRESKQQSFTGTSDDMSKFMDDSDEMMDGWEGTMDDAKEHVTLISMKVERL